MLHNEHSLISSLKHLSDRFCHLNRASFGPSFVLGVLILDQLTICTTKNYDFILLFFLLLRFSILFHGYTGLATIEEAGGKNLIFVSIKVLYLFESLRCIRLLNEIHRIILSRH